MIWMHNFMMDQNDWKKLDYIPVPQQDEVFVWKFDPNDFINITETLEELLSVEEQKRLDRFVNQESRWNFIICRGILHFLLSRAADCPLDLITIKDGAQGKPQLSDDAHIHPVPFNISHTQDLCLIALGKNLEVGIDVERIHELKEVSSLAHSYLSTEELDNWQKCDDDEKLAGFFEYWCAKEAILKAAGCGLSIHPQQVNTIEALANQPLRGVQEDGCFFEFRECILEPLSLGEDYKGCLAVFGKPDLINLYDFLPQLLTDSQIPFLNGRNVEK